MFKPSTVWPLWTVAGWGGWLVLVRLLVTLITSGYASQNRCFIKVTVPNQRVDNKTQVGQWHSKVKNRDAWDSISKEDSTSKNNVMVLFSSSCRGLGWGCLSITETYRTNTNKKTLAYWSLFGGKQIPGLEYFCINSHRLVAWRGYGKWSSASGGTLSNISSMVNWPLSWDVRSKKPVVFWIL